MMAPHMTHLTREIADHLDGWTADPIQSLMDERDHETQGQLCHASGAAVRLYFDSYRKRVRVSATWPCDVNGAYQSASSWGIVPCGTPGPEASLSPDRAPEALARDIKRRVLTPYLPLYAEAIAKRDAEVQRHDNLAAMTDRLVELANTAGPLANPHGALARRGRDTDRISIYGGDHRIMGDCWVSGDSVKFDRLSVPYEVAKQIIKLLAQASAERVAS